MSTEIFGDDRFAMYIDDVRRTDRVDPVRPRNEAVSWGRTARELSTYSTRCDRAEFAVAIAVAETPGVPDKILDVVESQPNGIDN